MQPIRPSTGSSITMDNAFQIYCGSEMLPLRQLRPQHIARLAGVCRDCPNPSLSTLSCLCKELGLSLPQVVTWFRDHRQYITNGEQTQVEAARVESSCSLQINRSRSSHTPEQIARLEEVFKDTKYPSANLRLRLSQELGITRHKVICWFTNRRRRMKMENLIQSYTGRKKLPLSQLTPEQMAGLAKVLRDCPNLSLFTLWCLSEELGLWLPQVMTWFLELRQDIANGEQRQVEAARVEGSYSSQLIQSLHKETPEQIARLEEVFKDWKYPSANLMWRLSQQLGITLYKVMCWFTNRRYQMKRKRDGYESPSAEESSKLHIVSEDHSHLKLLLEEDLHPNLDLTLSLNNDNHMTEPPIKYWFQNESYKLKINEGDEENSMLIQEKKQLRKGNTAFKASKSLFKGSSSCPKPAHPYTRAAMNHEVENFDLGEKVNRMYIMLDNLNVIPVMWISSNSSVRYISHKEN